MSEQGDFYRRLYNAARRLLPPGETIVCAISGGADSVAMLHGLQQVNQAETVLHHALRGTGLAGLAGMDAARPIRAGSAITLVRPMLGFRRSEIRLWLAEAGLPFREDSTNADKDRTRNRIRHELLPLA